MRLDEELVLKAIANVYSGHWRPGEDPPDAYLTLSDRMIAIEVSTLTQHVSDGENVRPRLSDDAAAIRLANKLNDELHKSIPHDRRVMLFLSSPIVEFRKTKASLSSEIVSLVERGGSERIERKVKIHNNEIDICISESEGGECKKIVAFVNNRFSDFRIEKNAAYILEGRISDKAKKCSRISFDGPIWLALLNDYFLADVDTYRQAMESISIKHPFERILIVSSRDSAVETLFPIERS